MVYIDTIIEFATDIELFVVLFVLSLCPFDISAGVGAFVIGLSQISSFYSASKSRYDWKSLKRNVNPQTANQPTAYSVQNTFYLHRKCMVSIHNITRKWDQRRNVP